MFEFDESALLDDIADQCNDNAEVTCKEVVAKIKAWSGSYAEVYDPRGASVVALLHRMIEVALEQSDYMTALICHTAVMQIEEANADNDEEEQESYAGL